MLARLRLAVEAANGRVGEWATRSPRRVGEELGGPGTSFLRTARLKTDAMYILACGYILGASSFSPHRSWASYRRFAHSRFRIGYRLFRKHLLQLFDFAAGNELFKRLVISAFGQIGL